MKRFFLHTLRVAAVLVLLIGLFSLTPSLLWFSTNNAEVPPGVWIMLGIKLLWLACAGVLIYRTSYCLALKTKS